MCNVLGICQSGNAYLHSKCDCCLEVVHGASGDPQVHAAYGSLSKACPVYIHVVKTIKQVCENLQKVRFCIEKKQITDKLLDWHTHSHFPLLMLVVLHSHLLFRLLQLHFRCNWLHPH